MARTHGNGAPDARALDTLASLGQGVIFEPGALLFHPETVHLGADVYVGHYAMLKGYHNAVMRIGDGCWIGQYAFLHSAGGLTIGARVGIGPRVSILTSSHVVAPGLTPIIDSPLTFAEVVIEDGADIGAGAVVLPGVTVGRGAQIGAGAVVSRDIPAGTVAAGVPARVVRHR